MIKDQKLENVIAIRLDEETDQRIQHQQGVENRRVKSEMARILLVEALDAREAKDGVVLAGRQRDLKKELRLKKKRA